MTIGCGTIIKQDLVRIDDAIADGSFYQNPALLAAVQRAQLADRPVHLIGLVSDGGVHSHIDHLYALIRLCHSHQVVAQLHMITDGRDTAPRAALGYLPELEALLQECGGHIGTVSGRYYVMDRDQRWDRVKLAWDAIVHGGAELRIGAAGDPDAATTPAKAMNSYCRRICPGWSKPAGGRRNDIFQFPQ